MGEIHQLHGTQASQARLLEQWITQITSQHPNEAVAKRWTELARATANKFQGPPMPTRSELDLKNLDGLSSEDKERTILEVEQYISDYMLDVRDQLMDVHRELLALQKSVAELEVKG